MSLLKNRTGDEHAFQAGKKYLRDPLSDFLNGVS